jgi:hypothetical protein
MGIVNYEFSPPRRRAKQTEHSAKKAKPLAGRNFASRLTTISVRQETSITVATHIALASLQTASF